MSVFSKLVDDKCIWSGEYVGFTNKIPGHFCIEFETQVFINYFCNFLFMIKYLQFTERLWLLTVKSLTMQIKLI